MERAIEARGLEKTFRKKRSLKELALRPFGAAEEVRALRGVDLDVRRGEIFGLLGPNGAGKTTLLKILACLILPDRGRARIDGFDTADEHRVKPRIGLVHSDERSFYWRLDARENLRFFATLYDVPRARREARIDELLARARLTDAADRPFADYSSGMKQRMAFARSLLHDPPILLMDEPTRSLDPASSLDVRRFVADELSGKDRKTIVIATHNLKEAEALCDRVAIVAGGRVIHVGSVDDIRRFGIDRETWEFEVDRWPEAASGPFEVVERASSEETGGERVRVAIRDGATVGEVVGAIVAQGASVRGCGRVEADLEEAFSRIVETEDGPGASPEAAR